MLEIKGRANEQAVRRWLNDFHGGNVPDLRPKDLLRLFQEQTGNGDVAYSTVYGVTKKAFDEGAKAVPVGQTTAGLPAPHKAPEKPFKLEIIEVQDMEFPDFQLHRTGKAIDRLFSDHTEDGGLYGGTVTIVVGESGVGKSTVLLDALASFQKQNPKTRVLYVSSEMTRNDILFYYKKSPSIARVPTLLMMDHVKDRTLSRALEAAFNGEHDVILLDSFQDSVVKLKEVEGWNGSQAESWLTGKMIDAAEEKGCAILAIQHMTKGGTYVGSTYLKHATQAMVEIKFDMSGQRYVEFTKNRRGGSGVGKRLYYTLENGEIRYDLERYQQHEEMRDIEAKDARRRQELSGGFDKIFDKSKKRGAEEEAVEEEVEAKD